MANEMNISPEGYISDETSVRYILKLAGPLIISTISFTIMQFVDRFMVSRLGTDALAAVMPAGYIAFIPGGFAAGLFASVGTYVSQSLGRGQKKDCANYCWQGIYIGLAFSFLVVIGVSPASHWIFSSLGHEPGVVEMEVTYFEIMLYANIVTVFVFVGSQFFMGIHRPIITMYAALITQVVNVIANYVLIFGKFGFPEMGIAGAGWGTFIGAAVGGGIRMWVFLGKDINAEFGSRRAMKIDFRRMLDLVKVGFPAGIELMLNVAVWGAILFWLVAQFGKEAQAASSAVLSCAHVSIMPIIGFKLALSAAVGKSIGGNKKEAVVKQTNLCLKIALVYMGLVGICFLLFRESIMAFWSSDDKVIEVGSKILILAAFYQVFHAARAIYSGSLRGAGDTLWLAIVSAAGAVLVLGLGGMVIVKLWPGLGAIGPWIAATLSIIVVGIANYWRFKSDGWRKIDLFKRKTLAVPLANGNVS